MEFRWDLSKIFKTNISKINYTLLPSDFSGDRSDAINCANQVADIIDTMGIASAKSQDLQTPITSSEKMRNLDHLMYLMVDFNGNNNKGRVVGLLRIGVKNLFLFDDSGKVHEKQSMCIHDFYIHESMQRSGFGKKLYDYMLYDKNIEPCKLALDKPPVSFLKFLYKHYGLAKVHPQNNHFVVFDGFFDEKSVSDVGKSVETSKHVAVDDYDNQNHSVRSDEYEPHLYGRHTAFKHGDTMGTIIQGSRSDPSPQSSGLVSTGEWEMNCQQSKST